MPRLDSAYKVSNSNVVPIDLISWNVAGKKVSINVYQRRVEVSPKMVVSSQVRPPNQAHIPIYSGWSCIIDEGKSMFR